MIAKFVFIYRGWGESSKDEKSLRFRASVLTVVEDQQPKQLPIISNAFMTSRQQDSMNSCRIWWYTDWTYLENQKRTGPMLIKIESSNRQPTSTPCQVIDVQRKGFRTLYSSTGPTCWNKDMLMQRLECRKDAVMDRAQNYRKEALILLWYDLEVPKVDAGEEKKKLGAWPLDRHISFDWVVELGPQTLHRWYNLVFAWPCPDRL